MEEVIDDSLLQANTLNELIAFKLGFKKAVFNDTMGLKIQWIYPKDWEDEIKATPMYTIPDFMKMINQVRDIAKMYNYGIPSEHTNILNMNHETTSRAKKGSYKE